MSNEIITATSEVDNLVNAVQAEARFDRLLKFKKGDYKVSDDDVPLGTEYLVHPAAWLKDAESQRLRGMRHTRLRRNSSGKSKASACTS